MSTEPFALEEFDPGTDFPALTELLNAAAAADSSTPTAEEVLRAQDDLYGRYGRLRRWVARRPGPRGPGLAAQAMLFKQSGTPYAEFSLVVRPRYREAGLEATLLGAVIGDAKALQSAYISTLLEAGNEALGGFFLGKGFTRHGGYRAMSMRLARPPAPAAFARGFELKTFAQVNDINTLAEIANRGWSDLPGHKVATAENLDWVNDQPHDSVFLLFDPAGRVAGCVSATVGGGGRGRVDAPGLTPQHRRPETYQAMALAGLGYLAGKGCEEVVLESWGDHDSTIAAYAELGFETTAHLVGYRLDLS